jgi:CHAT domain-containing protein/Flp pilus assembly protein TadD
MLSKVTHRYFCAPLFVMLLALTVFGQAPRQTEVRELPPAQTLERELSGGESHRYKFASPKDEFLEVKVEQKGIDVVVRLIDEKGKILKEVDSPNGTQGFESLTHITAEAGTYVIEVSSPDANAARAGYSILLAPPRAATKADAQRFQAEALFEEAKASTRTGTSELKQAALLKLEQAKELFQELGDKELEATCLAQMGDVYVGLGESQKALESFHEALALYQSIGYKSGEAITLTNLGGLYSNVGENAKALAYLEQALPIVRALGEKNGEAYVLTNMGNTYNALGERRKALDYYLLALPLHRAIGDKYGEAYTLTGVGNIYNRLGETAKALDYLGQALKLRQLVGDKRGEAQTLSNIGGVYVESGDRRKAAEYFEMSLPLRRAAGDKYGEGYTLYNLGGIYFELGEREKARDYLEKALLLRRLVGDKNGVAVTSFYLLHAWETWGNQRLAIFYGKQSVNEYQELRQEIQKLDKGTQRTFLRTIDNVYKRLAGVLIAENRTEEATQVINLLRDQEFFDFNRDATREVARTALTARETADLLLLQTATGKVGDAEKSLAALRRNLARRQATPDEAAELKRFEANAEKANADFPATLKSIEADFKQPASAADRVENVQDVADLRAALRELGATRQNPAALYTLIGDDKVHVLLITPDGEVKNFESPIKAAALNEKILAFYALLQSPVYDTRPLGKELYDIIFKPVEAELKRQNIQTLMWQLDGDLRYVPMAALWDGEKYLVERYQNVVFTRGNHERLTRTVSQSWTGAGFGSSRARTVDLLGDGAKIDFPAIPGVTAELRSIFRTGRKGPGILDGEVFSDDKFTKQTFYDAMGQHRPLVHISSHFSFRPGDDSRSFLLLGDGTALTLSEMKKQENLFAGVEMLTLSACNTAATQPDVNGKEIDGFAELAQRLGASAVMATLWQVSDSSTPWLMQDFYAKRQSKGATTKAAALRYAQLALLNGTANTKLFSDVPKGDGNSNIKVVLTPDASKQTRDSTRSEIVYVPEREAPLFKHDDKRPFAHPYYWSPFVLYGNWR